MAEVLEQADVAPSGVVLIAAVDIVGAEFVVRGPFGEQVPDDLQDGATVRIAILCPPVPADPTVARPQGGALHPDGGEGGLQEGRLKPPVPLAGPAAAVMMAAPPLA